MKKLTSTEMRNLWFSFWKSKGHDILESASLIPYNDPTLLWINAGVAPLKKYFDGTEVPHNRRLASSQKCIRTNDIENVGKTARHQTFFEMLGNFSIGDYFKKEAITWAFEFLTSPEYLDMDKDKLYMTIYPNDNEAYDIWRSLGVSDDHIIKLEDNFWEIGPGPSGPDSEIFYDRGIKYDPDNIGIRLLKEDIENDRYIEIWNNVFSQYNAIEGISRSEYPELPSKNIDTGMGLERIVSVLQEVDTNFDTDLFVPIINKIEEISGKKYNGEMAFKVIADHIRTITFALADGANFGNSGREYVLRRLLRRAVRYGRILGLEKPFMADIVDSVIEIMKDSYPYLLGCEDKVKKLVTKEEVLFNQTLVIGEKKLNELFINNTSKKISGEDAFKLYDTYGFPFELTEEICEEKGFIVSKEEFDIFMIKQRELARNSRNNISSMNIQNEELINFKEESIFVGYDRDEVETEVIAVFKGTDLNSELTGYNYIVTRETPFYVESGGQVSDDGIIVKNNEIFKVERLFKGPNGQVFHLVNNNLNINDKVILKIDVSKREAIRKNHSAVHLLQKSLQKILSDDIHQAGSYVDEKRFRFDFTYDYKISKKDLIEIEEDINKTIKNDIPTSTEIMSIDEAKRSGAMALFDSKYGDKVRVVTIADSKELCGGTHVRNVKDINRFAIASLESKGANIYRIEGTTDENVEEVLFAVIKPYNDDMIKLLDKAKDIIIEAAKLGFTLDFDYNLFDINHDTPVTYKDIIFNQEEVRKTKEIVGNLDNAFEEMKVKKALENIEQFENALETINNTNVIIKAIKDYEIKAIKEIVDTLCSKYQNSFILIINEVGDNVNLVSKSNSSIHAGNIIKDIVSKLDGKGGGSPTFAQGGGKLLLPINQIIELVKEEISE